jgi:uncharacterized protein (TIGR02594 family)
MSAIPILPGGTTVVLQGEPLWILIAKRYIGLHEGPGSEDNPEVLKFYARAGHPEIRHDSVAWCAAFLGSVLQEAGLKGTGSLMARSYERWGIPLNRPRYGCIGVKTRRGGGHVTFVLGETPTNYICLGGNQGDRVCIEAIPKRATSGSFTALRWPADAPLSANPYPLLVSVPNLKTGLGEA